MSFTRADYPPLSTIGYISSFTSVIFNPTSIAGGVLWLDASLFTQANNTAVTTWPSATASYSLSMTGTGTVNTNILNGLPVISVSTSQNWSLSAGYTSASYTFFFVSRQTGGTNRRVFIGNGNKLYGYWGGNKNSLYTEGWIANLNSSDTAWDIYTIVRTSSGSGTFSRFGGNLATYASSGAGMDGFYINTGGNHGGETSDAQIAEVLIYNVDLSDANCRKIEGYLAWKWGLQANLTSGHIHASSGPNSFASSTTSTILLNLTGYVQSGANYILKPQIPLATLGYYTGFNPITLSTLALWIDGSDPLGTGIAPAQSTLLSSLKDKSGNNRAISTFSTTVGFPIYRTAANGALGAIQLAAGNGIFLSSIALTPMMTLYAVYSPILPSTGIAIEQGVNALANAGFLLTSVSTISTIYAIGIPAGIVATGGTVTTAGDFKYHVFTVSGTFTLSNSGTVSYLIVGGGGGGGDRHGGGGGAGGVLSSTWAATPGSYTITVGLGGIAGNYETSNSTPRGAGIKGGDSSISSVATAFGGGGGGTLDGNPTGTVGSGGGGGGGSLAGVAGTAGQGFVGGSGQNPGGGGGGGAGGAGVNANTGTGGIGITSVSTQLLAVGYGTSFAVPTSPNVVISGGVAYIGGGGGGASGSSPGPGGSGGLGGGGRGDWDASFILAGTANTGGGGGGSRSADVSTTGRDGGSGLVLLWYPLTNAPVATGGTVTISGAYKIHTFTTTGNTTFTLTNPASISAQVLVVGGGGAGGSADVGGGGGAGGAVFNGSFTIASGSYTVTVGAGGIRTVTGVGYVGPSGVNSSFSSITGNGGGGGGSYAGVAATNGGCGGGGPFNSGQFGTGSQGGNGAPYGTDGNGGYNCGGGGGGMGGTAPTPSGVRPSGGAGATYTVAGTAYTLAGGGGAGSDGVGGLGQAGGGLGGNGGGGGGATSGTDATANTGSGGGGGGGNNGSLYGGAGGSGIVIIAYLA